ncbi:Ubiquitin carboxyl-terminal hydrolase 3 [Camelus dromedarius]|uniref:Ubiquitin carboxyl-terminal hydrolase 3 n=1 Tax=Camelus dromedarius TaxID=9838 RepID=A0A5N4E4B9_CAMDR|nr:Ubiquitin carboxyl-terminal hydrolase 3 [Camelus dromedarius]
MTRAPHMSLHYRCDDFVVNDTKLGLVQKVRERLQNLENYRCDDFVVNDTKLGLVQKVREHLQNLENSAFAADRHRKRKLLENSSLNSKLLKVNTLPGFCSVGSTTAICARPAEFGEHVFMNAVLQSLRNIEQFCCYIQRTAAGVKEWRKTEGQTDVHTRTPGGQHEWS